MPKKDVRMEVATILESLQVVKSQISSLQKQLDSITAYMADETKESIQDFYAKSILLSRVTATLTSILSHELGLREGVIPVIQSNKKPESLE